MNMHNFISSASQALTQFIQQFVPDIPAEVIRYGGAGLLCAVAFILILLALRMLRSGKRNGPSQRINIPRTLQHEGGAIDILNSLDDDDVAVRCVITTASSGRIKCEIIERLDVIKTREGNEVVCVFAPLKTDKGKINSFTAHLIESETSGRKADRIILSAPTNYTLTPRRKHARKRVADQQFIRVKLWIDNPYTSDISFEDASPHIGINSFTNEGPDQSANAVVNISNGGLGLSVQNRVIPETCAVGASVAINLFMFNFKEKSFKPYWYAGEIRSMEEGRPGFTRMGIEFSGSGEPCGDTCTILWNEF